MPWGGQSARASSPISMHLSEVFLFYLQWNWMLLCTYIFIYLLLLGGRLLIQNDKIWKGHIFYIPILSTPWQKALSILSWYPYLFFLLVRLKWSRFGKYFFLECNYFNSSKTKWEIYTNCKNRPDISKPTLSFPSGCWDRIRWAAGNPKISNMISLEAILWDRTPGLFFFFSRSARNA